MSITLSIYLIRNGEIMRACRMCGKEIMNDSPVCKQCNHRLRNAKYIATWICKVMGYPTDEELKEDQENNDVVIAS